MKTLAAVFNSPNQAVRAIEDLQSAGIDPQVVGVIAHPDLARRVAAETGAEVATGAVGGAGLGAILGGVAGWLVGAGLLTIPGIGPVLAAGPLAAALGGAGMGAVAGGLIGALTGWGFSEAQAREYETRVKRGDILLTVDLAEDLSGRAEDILRQNGGDHVSSTERREMADRGPA